MLNRKKTQHSTQPKKTDDISLLRQQFLRERRLRNERRNSILMTCHYPDLGTTSDWFKQISQVARPIRSTNQIWVATRHQYGISAQWWRREQSHPTRTLCKGPLIGVSKSKCLPFFRSLPRSPSTIGAGTRLIRLQVIEGPNVHDQVTFCALHSFLMEIKTNSGYTGAAQV